MVGESTEAVGAGVGGGSSGNKMPTLEEYGTNLTKLAEEVDHICAMSVSLWCLSHLKCLVKCAKYILSFFRVNLILLLEGSRKLSVSLKFWAGGQRIIPALLESLVLGRQLLPKG